LFIYFIGFVVLFLDQFTKHLALRNLSLKSIPIIKNVLHLTLTFNTGAAFGILKGYNPFFIFVSIVIIIFFSLNLKGFEKKNFLFKCSVGLILGGAIGNLIDRVRFGYVIDFIDLRVWPVFNIADSSVTVGIFLFILNHLIRTQK